MNALLKISIAAALATSCATGYAQAPVAKDAAPAAAAATPGMPMNMAGADARMAQMDQHTQAMGAMHEKMMAAKTPEERRALMVEHRKLMQAGMATMGTGNGGMRRMHGNSPTAGDRDAHYQMMEKRMEMMESMMQMMVDRMDQDPEKASTK